MDDRLVPLRDLMASYARVAVGSPVRSVAVLGNAPLDPSEARAEAMREYFLRAAHMLANTDEASAASPGASPIGRPTL